MSIPTRLQIWRSEWKKLREEIIRIAAILRANQRESEERRKRIQAYDARHEQQMAEIDRIHARLDLHHIAEQEKWLTERARLSAEIECAKRELDKAKRELDKAKRERQRLLSVLSSTTDQQF